MIWQQGFDSPTGYDDFRRRGPPFRSVVGHLLAIRLIPKLLQTTVNNRQQPSFLPDTELDTGKKSKRQPGQRDRRLKTV